MWNAPPSAVDAYHLEADIYTPTQVPNEKEQRETLKVSLGTACKYNLECLHYNARVTARVRASNRAGQGPFSKDITILTEKGKVRKNRFHLLHFPLLFQCVRRGGLVVIESIKFQIGQSGFELSQGNLYPVLGQASLLSKRRSIN